MDSLYLDFRGKALRELMQLLQIEDDNTATAIARPPSSITVGAARHCVGYKTKPSIAATWRHLQEKVASLTEAMGHGNVHQADDLKIYLLRFVP